MKLRVGAFALAGLLLLGGCSKPSQQQSDNSATPGDNAAAASDSTTAQAASRMPVSVTIPSGKVLTVRLSSAVGSKLSEPGQSFGGALAKPVEVDGEVVIPAGARVEGEVVDAKPLGRFAGGALLQ